MSKIVFVQREIEDKLGPMILAAFLKANTYDAKIIIDPYKNIKRIKEINPDFIGISLLSPSVDWTIDACRFLKTQIPDALLILGGPHPTYFPKVIEEDGVDIICIGEGEKPLLRIMQSYDGTLSSIENTSNIWIKKGSSIIKNKIGSLLTEEELTQLPFSDRTHYFEYPALRNNPHKKIWISRGCPYSCSFCFNHKYKEIYKGFGKMVRQRSVDSVINELMELKKYGWKCLEIVDDQFLISKNWIYEFCEKYANYINLPFTCNSGAKLIKKDIVASLKKAGCKVVYFGIESGVENIRKDIYNKPISDNDIYNAADALHSCNMPFLTHNMIGLPDESMEDIFKTIEINQEINTTFPWCSILQPYPGTRIAKIMKEKGIDLPSKFTYSFFQSSMIVDPKKHKIFSNSQKLFTYLVKSNANYGKFVRMVQNMPPKSDSFYSMVFYWYYGQSIRKRYGMSWLSLFRYWLYSKL